MADKKYTGFLGRQFFDGMGLAAQSQLINLRPIGEHPPQQYHYTVLAKGLVKNRAGEIIEAERADFAINFPPDYLCRAKVEEVILYLGPHPGVFHPNFSFKAPWVCLNIRPGMSLSDLMHKTYDLWTWNLFNTRDGGLNVEAGLWTIRQPKGTFPIDNRPMRWQPEE